MTIRMQLKPGGVNKQHNEALQMRSTFKAGALRRKIRAGSKGDRLRLLVVRAGLKAGTGRGREGG